MFTYCFLFSATLVILLLPDSTFAQSFPAARTGGNYMHNYYLPPPSPESPRWPAWSPDGAWLAFAMHGSIWRLKVGTGVVEALTENPTYDSSPAWSPDGKWIAYTAETDGQTIDLMILNVETGLSVPLKAGEHLFLDPAWSPDGSRLAFVSTEPTGYYNIYIQSVKEGRAIGGAVALTQDNRFGRSRLYFSDNDLYVQPTWSPDGREIMFLSNRGIPLGSGAVWRMPAEHNGIDKARIIHNEQTLYRTRPDWSPDGSRFVYSSHAGGQYNQLYMLPAEGGHPYKITFGDWDHFHPRWSPDGSRIAFLSNEHGVPQIKLFNTVGGQITDVVITEKNWRTPHGRIAVTIIDDATGKATPARVYAVASDHKSYAPDGHYHRVGRLNEHFFHSNGEFTMEVPVGQVSIEAVKGFEYWPDSAKVEVLEEKTTSLSLSLRRMTDMPEQGWYSGSSHVHMNYAGDLHNTLENLMFMSEAEDQAVVNELVANKDNRILDYQFFTGGVDPVSTSERVLQVGQEYRPAFHGHVFLLDLKEYLLSPFASGYEGTAIHSLHPTNTEVFRLAEKQGAFRGYVHPFSGENDPNSGDNPSLGGAKAFPVDAAFGTVEALEMSTANHAAYIVWHHMLNNDFQIIPTGGEDSISNLYRTAIVGQVRTYVYLGDRPLSWDNWMAGLRKGHTIVTNGPLPTFTIDGKLPGEAVHLPEDGGKITLKGKVQSIVPLDRAVIYRNGQIVERIPLDSGNRAAAFTLGLHVTSSGWYTLQVEADQPTHPIDDGYPQATTNAIRVYVGDQPIRDRGSAHYFVQWINRLIQMAEVHPGWRSQDERNHVIGQFIDARAVYEELAK